MANQPPKGAREGRRMMDAPVDLNHADREQLSAVEGIGNARADRIIEWRERNGSFAAVEDLQRVPEFTPEVIADIRDQVRV